MQTVYRISRVLVLALLALVVVACETETNTPGDAVAVEVEPTAPTVPDNAVEISIIYAPESDLYMPDVIRDFNEAYLEGRNPVTGQPLAEDEQPIVVTGEPGSSGVIMQAIVNAFIAPNNENVARPTIFGPSVSHWLALANHLAGREIFDLANSPATANAPVVMAIWESRLEALQRANPDEQIGWTHLLEVLNNPEGWRAYGIDTDRTSVYYGHTDPFVSSTALSTLIAEYYASAQALDITERQLSMETVMDEEVRDGVRDIEDLIRHYSRRTTEFKEYIAQGPDYLDFVALEENDLIFINQGLTEFQPPEPLVALYPAEGTFWHEHPFGVVQARVADWVTPEQEAAAFVFADYVRSVPVQERIMSEGFRPVNPDVEIGYPFVPEYGVDPAQPFTVLQVPEPEVIAAVQESWNFVKKQADIWLLIDTSGSMYGTNGEKLRQAQEAAIDFVNDTEVNNRVGLIEFNTEARVVVALDTVESNRAALIEGIEALQADGDTALFSGLVEAIEMHEDESSQDRIRAIVLLSDGANTIEDMPLQTVLARIEEERSARNPVVVIPIAYGGDADIRTLSSIAEASNTRVQSGDPDEIRTLLELISSYF
ncbi:MAG: vWA domain-containing protein [Anaerolineales bacterium]